MCVQSVTKIGLRHVFRRVRRLFFDAAPTFTAPHDLARCAHPQPNASGRHAYNSNLSDSNVATVTLNVTSTAIEYPIYLPLVPKDS